MHNIRKTLVVVDPDQDQEPLLDKAKMIAGATRSHLHLLICDKQLNHTSLLETLADKLAAQGFSSTAQHAWHGCPASTTITVAAAESCGLVIKQHRPDNPLLKSILTPDDWKLLRDCACPVLIVKNATPWADGVILAAIDVGNTDVQHRLLQAGIVSHGHDIARLMGGTLHLMSAHPFPTLSAADPVFQLKDSLATFYRAQCTTFQEEFGIDDSQLHIEEGPAELLIPQVAHNLRAAVTVVGDVGRRGLAGALVGNTAEMILDSLDTDLLVIKPGDVIAHLEELAAPMSTTVDPALVHSWPYHHHHRAQP